METVLSARNTRNVRNAWMFPNVPSLPEASKINVRYLQESKKKHVTLQVRGQRTIQDAV